MNNWPGPLAEEQVIAELQNACAGEGSLDLRTCQPALRLEIDPAIVSHLLEF